MAITTRELKHLLAGLREVPTLPPIAVRLIEATSGPEADFQEIARLIKSDQSLAAKILRVANSASFGAARQVNTVERAIVLLGQNLVRNLALSILVFDTFGSEGGERFDLTEFWRHCGTCAIASEQLARRFGYPQPEEAFVAGLLHDMGKLCLYNVDPEGYEAVVEESFASRTPLLAVEEARLKMGHTQVAKVLMEQWNFPASLVHSAWLHHQPLTEFGPQPKQQLPFIVKCANTLCHVQHFGNSGNPALIFSLDTLTRITGLPAEELEDLSRTVLEKFEGLAESFDWKSNSQEIYLSAVRRANLRLAQMYEELELQYREVEMQNRVLEATAQAQEILPAGIGLSQGLDKLIEPLESVLPYRRLMVFVPLEREQVIEGRVRFGNQGEILRVVLPLTGSSLQDPRQLTPREQVFLIERGVQELGEKLSVGEEIVAALQSNELAVLPLAAGGSMLGQILVEPFQSSHTEKSRMKVLRQYARVAALSLERILLVEALEQQAEDLARMARTTQETQMRLFQSERLASVGRLAAGAAHEINNPLATVKARAELLMRSAQDERIRSSLKSIITQSDRIAKIIRDLMGLARPAEPKTEWTDLRQVWKNSMGVLESRVSFSGIRLKEEFQPGLPQLKVDPNQMEQVFLNLAINAVHAMPDGGTLTVRMRVSQDGQSVEIEFEDTGLGIPTDSLSSVFDPFFTTKSEGEGTGLGLAICNTIVETHRGKITARSEKNRGTTFQIRLPIESDPYPLRPLKPERKEASVPLRADEDPLSPARILIVDDEDPLRLVMSEALRLEGYRVDVASAVDEGLAFLDEGIYDLVLLDWRMPGRPARELLEMVRKKFPELKVVVVSGMPVDLEFDDLQLPLSGRLLKKPFEMDHLLRTVRQTLTADDSSTDSRP